MENEKKTPQKRKYEKKKFNKNKFEKLCSLQCTATEICTELGISRVTLNSKLKEHYNKTFKEVFEEKRTKGFVSLRKAQFKMAMENVKMNIFLSKNYLGMSDIVINNNDEEVTKFENMILNLKHELQNSPSENEGEQDE